eukprot:TRINITY_DN1792_c0_g1_i1.p1 TRINITY_DN1792_c0_g1~~TRINITY_DN1792_c0_g1_i1.p1  ORF type:complete len:1094 (-),score=267.41 TRINITY_DN1792_c0_g1_i1:41-2926(-)
MPLQNTVTKYNSLPKPVSLPILYIRDVADTPGIFKTTGTPVHVQKAKDLLDQGLVPEFGNPHVAAEILRLYFAELPDPLLTVALYHEFVEASKQSDDETLKQVIAKLPHVNYDTSRFLMEFLNTVVTRSESNGTTSHDLACVFGPAILRSKESKNINKDSPCSHKRDSPSPHSEHTHHHEHHETHADDDDVAVNLCARMIDQWATLFPTKSAFVEAEGNKQPEMWKKMRRELPPTPRRRAPPPPRKQETPPATAVLDPPEKNASPHSPVEHNDSATTSPASCASPSLPQSPSPTPTPTPSPSPSPSLSPSPSPSPSPAAGPEPPSKSETPKKAEPAATPELSRMPFPATAAPATAARGPSPRSPSPHGPAKPESDLWGYPNKEIAEDSDTHVAAASPHAEKSPAVPPQTVVVKEEGKTPPPADTEHEPNTRTASAQPAKQTKHEADPWANLSKTPSPAVEVKGPSPAQGRRRPVSPSKLESDLWGALSSKPAEPAVPSNPAVTSPATPKSSAKPVSDMWASLAKGGSAPSPAAQPVTLAGPAPFPSRSVVVSSSSAPAPLSSPLSRSAVVSSSSAQVTSPRPRFSRAKEPVVAAGTDSFWAQLNTNVSTNTTLKAPEGQTPNYNADPSPSPTPSPSPPPLNAVPSADCAIQALAGASLQGPYPYQEDRFIIISPFPTAPSTMPVGWMCDTTPEGKRYFKDSISKLTHWALPPIVEKEMHFFGLYDGHGGHSAAEFCMRQLASIVVAEDSFHNGDMRAALIAGYVTTDNKFRQRPFACGCTALAVFLVGHTLWVANAGDCRCVLGRRDHTAVPLTQDHKPNDPKELERITAAGCKVVKENVTAEDGTIMGAVHRVDGRLAVARAIGDAEFKQDYLPPEKQAVTCVPDVFCHDITPEDHFIVLGCDGLWDTMTNEQVVARVSKLLGDKPAGVQNAQLESIATSLCAESGLIDNTTAVIVVFKK